MPAESSTHRAADTLTSHAAHARSCARLLSMFFTRHIFSSLVSERVQPLGAARLCTTRGQRAAWRLPERLGFRAGSGASHRARFRRGDIRAQPCLDPRRAVPHLCRYRRPRRRARGTQTLRYQNTKIKAAPSVVRLTDLCFTCERPLDTSGRATAAPCDAGASVPRQLWRRVH